MIYPGNFEQKIGFDKIRDLLKDQCISPLGQKHVEKISFVSGHGELQELLNRTEEFRQILLTGKSFPNSGYFDLTAELKRIQLKGTYIEIALLFDLKTSLQTIHGILAFFADAEPGLYPELSRLTEGLEPRYDLLSEIERIVDDRGHITDNASPALKEIRQSLHRKQLSIDRRIKKSMQEARSSGISPENAEVTIRNGRMVIPVLAAGKRQLKGFIHDESATGQTVYIEPTDVFDLNNEIREMENAERREIINILIEFTNMLRMHSDMLFLAYDFLGRMDFIRAKAKLALRIHGIKPLLKPTPMFNWRNARHPLLYLSLREQSKDVVPMDLELNNKYRILVISGPNAGGKSVCLKTAGLLQYMLQSGLLVPMEENSEAGIFRDIFLDIGDEQSLENDLSTYSSHLINIREFITHANRNSLFLIDEFGTGTEPHLGGAIAEASLQALNKKKTFGVVTSHYANIKLLADSEPGILNGAMLFDTREMRPLYMLQTGKPGSSFAFEIARKIGFPEDVLEDATGITGYSQLDFEKQLQELETEKMHLEKEKVKFGVADSFLAELIEKYEKMIDDISARKTQIIEDARREAAEILSGSNRLIEHTIKEIKEAEAEKEKTRELRKRHQSETEEILNKAVRGTGDEGRGKKNKKPVAGDQKPVTRKKKVKGESDRREKKYMEGIPQAGDWVEITEYGTTGEVVSVKGKTATIQSGSMSIKVSLKGLKRIQRPRQKDNDGFRKSKAYGNIMNDINERASRFKSTIDLRGKRAIEALDEIKAYMDDAILLSVKEVSILHGTGDGVLRNVIREYLQSIDEVEQISDAHVERGGQGITIVRIR
jgi:DNA mismatch repair protein MutS2